MSALLPLARKAMHFFPLATPAQRASQAAKWARAMVILGDHWILSRNAK